MTSLFVVRSAKLEPVTRSSLSSEKNLEDWIVKDPSILGLDILIIGRQVKTYFNKYIDILAIDNKGNIFIIELKKDRTPRDIVGQILDYASWVVMLNTKDIYDIANNYLDKDLSAAFLEYFDMVVPESLNDDHNMIIVASEFDASSKRIVEYLSETHGIAINTTFFNVFEHKGETFISADWLLDQQDVVERSETKRKAPWAGYWYVNVGDGDHRSWEDMRKHNFLAAGYGSIYSNPLGRLNVGEPIFAYQKGKGYVGFGVVTQTKILASQFTVNGKNLFDVDLLQPNLKHDSDDEERAEYVIGVDWKQTFPLNEAKTFQGVFANQNIVCKLRHPETLEFLKKAFNVDERTSL